MLNLILFGPPGSGKGTQADKLVEKYGLVHISTGDLFRYEMNNETGLGLKAEQYMAAGQLVPDEVTIAMLENRVDQHADADGFIFDGFPRTTQQAQALDAFLGQRGTSVTGLVALEVSEEEIIKRILLRGKTSGRPDDNDADIIRKRIQVYRDETTPVFDHYAEEDKSFEVDGMGSIDDIFARLCQVIDSLAKSAG